MGPGAVGDQLDPFELAEADVVQVREDKPRHVAAGERQLGRFTRALKFRGDAQIEPLGGQLPAKASTEAPKRWPP